MNEQEKNELKQIIWEVLVDFQNYNNRKTIAFNWPEGGRKYPKPPPGYLDLPKYVGKNDN